MGSTTAQLIQRDLMGTISEVSKEVMNKKIDEILNEESSFLSSHSYLLPMLSARLILALLALTLKFTMLIGPKTS